MLGARARLEFVLHEFAYIRHRFAKFRLSQRQLPCLPSSQIQHLCGGALRSAVELAFLPLRFLLVNNLGVRNNPDRNIAREQTRRRQTARSLPVRAQSRLPHLFPACLGTCPQAPDYLLSERCAWDEAQSCELHFGLSRAEPRNAPTL